MVDTPVGPRVSLWPVRVVPNWFKRRRARALVDALLSGTADSKRTALKLKLRALGVPGFDVTARALALATSESVRDDLAWAFCGYGPAALDCYVQALSDPSPHLRANAALGIQYVGPRAVPAAPALLPLLADPDPEVAERTVWAFKELGAATVPLLRRVRAGGPGHQRRRALQALVEIAGEGGLSAADRAAVQRLIRIKLLTERPEPFTPCTSWLAVAGGDQVGIIRELDLTDCRPATLAMGVDTVHYNSHGWHPGLNRPSLSRVFITPEIAGWTLVLGNWVAPVLPDRRAAVAGYCMRLSERYGRAQAYGFDAQTWESAWLIAEDGQVVRHFIDDDTSVGSPLPVERDFLSYEEWDAACEAADSIDEQPPRCTALTVAEAMSINPERLGPDTPVRGHGVLTLTPHGARHGTPPGATRI
jgi:hypothetical protein